MRSGRERLDNPTLMDGFASQSQLNDYIYWWMLRKDTPHDVSDTPPSQDVNLEGRRKKARESSIPSKTRHKHHLILGKRIRDQGARALNPCRLCLKASEDCWVGTNSKRCARCAEQGHAQRECAVDLEQQFTEENDSQSSVLSYDSIYYYWSTDVSSESQYATSVIALTVQRRGMGSFSEPYNDQLLRYPQKKHAPGRVSNPRRRKKSFGFRWGKWILWCTCETHNPWWFSRTWYISRSRHSPWWFSWRWNSSR